MRHITLILFIISLISCSENRKTVINHSTDYFEFKNSYWVNLHHFLYQKADSSQLRKLQEDNLDFIEIGDADLLVQLSQDEKDILNQAIKYYKDSLTAKSLRRDLSDFKNWLQKQEESKVLKDTTYGKKVIEVLNIVSPIYEKQFWQLHKSHNLSVINKHIATIDEIEEEVINKMETFSLNKWPDSTKVRVDITTYANWAGAYTVSKPRMNIVISSLDPHNVTSSFVETILHEGSHLLYLFGESPIRDKIYNKSEELGIEFPRNLWHASMFYLCGRATQDELSNLDIKHEMVMIERSIFSNYNSDEFININEKYYNNKIDANLMVFNLLNEIKEKSH